MDVPNIAWVCPVGQQGSLLVFSSFTTTRAGFEETRYRCYRWSNGVAKYSFTSEACGNVIVSKDGRQVIVNQPYYTQIFRQGFEKPLKTVLGARWTVDGKLATISLDRNGRYCELRVNGRRAKSAPKRIPFLFSSCGRFVLTATEVWQSRKEWEENAAMTKYRVQVWHLTGKGLGKLYRELGIFYWDGGSTGDPADLEVSSEGVILSSLPGGGGVLARPYVIVPKGRARWLFGDQWDYAHATEGVISVGRHLITRFRSYPAGQREEVGTGDYDDIPQWIAWTDGRTMAVRRCPRNLVGLWGIGNTTLCIATEVPGGVAIERVQLPPTKWEQHFLGEPVKQLR